MRFRCITTDQIMKTIEGLESKTSSGHDGTSNTLLKVIKASISQSLTIMINQMLTTGIFPDVFKVSKVISLYKKGDSSLLVHILLSGSQIIIGPYRYCLPYQRFFRKLSTTNCTIILTNINY